MKNILVPIDFSEPAIHAAHYAIALATHLKAERLILYNSYQQPLPADPLLLEPNFNAVEIYNIPDLGNISREHLLSFKNSIAEEAPASLQIDTIGEYNDLTDGIEEICKAQNIDLVVTGITVGDKLSETFVGSHAIDIAKQIITPVLIVPHEADYKQIQNILFACDYKGVEETTPILSLQKILTATSASLHILHVKESNKKEETLTTGNTLLQNLLQLASPTFHEVESTNFAEAINQFISENNIDLVVAIPKKHGFFEGMFRKSHIKTLAFHTHIPLMLMHEG